MISNAADVRSKPMPVYDSSAFKVPLIYEFQELIKYRFLVWNLILRDLKVRYKRSSIGFIWVMLNPLLTMGVLAIVFSHLFRFQVPHFAVYLLSGILLWNLYAQGSVAAMTNVQANGQILRKLYVPPSVFVASSIGSGGVNFLFALGPYLVLALLNGLPLSLSWFFLILPVIFALMFTFGVGLIAGALVVFFSDTYEIYLVLVNTYYFLTPVMYPINILPEPIRTIAHFNPMYLYLDTFRVAVLYSALPSLSEFVWAGVSALLVLVIGWFVFTRVEDKFVYYF